MFTLDFFLEWTGALFGLACVILTAKRRIVSWPVGLISVVCFAVFFYRIRLYADMGLQGFYFATGLYGWWHWARGGAGGTEAPIRVLTTKARVGVLVAVLFATPLIAWTLATRTQASLPALDSLTAVLSVAAQLLLMRKVFESWILWIAVDVLSLALYGLKGAWVTFGLYGIFLGVAIAGLLAWRAALKREAVR